MRGLADCEVHCCMHFLDVTTLLRFARCSRRLLYVANQPGAWRGGGVMQLHFMHRFFNPQKWPAAAAARSLMRHAMAHRPFALQFTAPPRLGGPGAPFETFLHRVVSSPLGSILELDVSDVNLPASDCLRLLNEQQSCIQGLRLLKLKAMQPSPAEWKDPQQRLIRLPHLHTLHVQSQHAALIIDQLLARETPSLRVLLVAGCLPPESLFAAAAEDDKRMSLLESFTAWVVSPELLCLLAARCGATLQTLRVSRSRESPQAALDLLPTQFPALTRLRFRDEWWLVQEPTSLDWIARFPRLRRLHLISPALFVGRFRSLFGSGSPLLQANLEELHLQYFSADKANWVGHENGSPEPPSPADFAEVWRGLQRMRRLTLTGCTGLPTLLRDLHLACSLEDLCIAPSSQFTEVPLLRSLLLAIPTLHLTVRFPTVEKPPHWSQRRHDDQPDRRWVMALLPCFDPLRFIPALEGRFHVRFDGRED